MISIPACNINYDHDPEYVLHKSSGTKGMWVFIHCLSTCEMGTSTGIHRAEKGDCILYGPRDAQWNYSLDGVLVNDWAHFCGDDVQQALHKYSIETNTLLHPLDSSFIQPQIRSMRQEIYESRPRFKESLHHQALLFFISLSRQLNEQTDLSLSDSEYKHLSAFRILRSSIQQDLCKEWTATLMASTVGLSRTRFTVLYTKIFRISPIEDLLQARLRRAEGLLFDSPFTVEEVARLSGFKNPIYFHRIFKKRMGRSPRAYTTTKITKSKAGQDVPLHHQAPSILK